MGEQSAQDQQKPAKKIRRAKYWLKEGVMVIIVFIVFSTMMDYWRSQDMPDGSIPPACRPDSSRREHRLGYIKP